MLDHTLSQLFNPVAEWCLNEFPQIAYNEFPKAIVMAALGSAFTIAISKYCALQQSRHDRKAMAEQRFDDDHVAVVSLTQYTADGADPGTTHQDITTLNGAMPLTKMFRRSYNEVMPLLEQAAELSEKTGNPNLLQLLPEVIRLNGREKELTAIMQTVEDDWKNAFSPFWNAEQDITRYFNARDMRNVIDQDRQVTIFPVLTRSKEGAQHFRVLMLTKDQLQPGILPQQDDIRYETHDGYEVDKSVQEGASRLSTIKNIASHMDEVTKELLYVRVRGDYGPKLEERLERHESDTPAHDDEPIIIPFPGQSSIYDNEPHIAA